MSIKIIEYFSVFLAVSCIVSFDVAALTLSKSNYFLRHKEQINSWSLINAFYHAALLLLYIFIITGILDLSLKPFEYFLNIIRNIEFLHGYYESLKHTLISIKDGLMMILSFLTVFVVINTYRDKITSIPENGSISDLPTFIRLILCLFAYLKFKLGKKHKNLEQLRLEISHHLQAALVAVDMLAIAILLKSMNLLSNIEWDFAFVTLVFCIVFLITKKIAIWSTNKLNNIIHSDPCGEENFRRKFLQLSFRLIEPLFIFYFLLGLLVFVWTRNFDQSIYTFFIAGIMVLLLVKDAKLDNVISSSITNFNDKNYQEDITEYLLIKNIKEIIKKYFKWFFIILGGIIIFSILRYIIEFLTKKIFSLEEIINYIILSSVITAYLAYLLIPSPRVAKWFDNYYCQTINILSNLPHTFYMATFALFSTLLVSFLELLSNGSIKWNGSFLDTLSYLENNQKFALKFLIWIIFISVSSVVLVRTGKVFDKLVKKGVYKESEKQGIKNRRYAKALSIIMSCSFLITTSFTQSHLN